MRSLCLMASHVIKLLVAYFRKSDAMSALPTEQQLRRRHQETRTKRTYQYVRLAVTTATDEFS